MFIWSGTKGSRALACLAPHGHRNCGLCICAEPDDIFTLHGRGFHWKILCLDQMSIPTVPHSMKFGVASNTGSNTLGTLRTQRVKDSEGCGEMDVV